MPRTPVPPRSNCISARLTADEYASLRRVAGERTMSDWAREALLSTLSPDPRDVTLLAEVLALRMILLNLVFDLAAGQPPKAEAMRRLIDRADQEKVRTAIERLASDLKPGR